MASVRGKRLNSSVYSIEQNFGLLLPVPRTVYTKRATSTFSTPRSPRTLKETQNTFKDHINGWLQLFFWIKTTVHWEWLNQLRGKFENVFIQLIILFFFSKTSRFMIFIHLRGTANLSTDSWKNARVVKAMLFEAAPRYIICSTNTMTFLWVTQVFNTPRNMRTLSKLCQPYERNHWCHQRQQCCSCKSKKWVCQLHLTYNITCKVKKKKKKSTHSCWM